MGAINISNVMDAIQETLVENDVAVRVYPWPIQNVNPPCIVIGYPDDDIVFDSTFHRGSDEVVFPVYYVVGQTADKNARDLLSEIIQSDFKEALDGNLGGAVNASTVRSARIVEYVSGDITYLAARFNVEIFS